MPKVNIPKPRKYALTYTNKKGETNTHIVSVPIEMSDDRFTCYSWTRKSLRTFLTNSVVAMSEIKEVRNVVVASA